MTSILALLELGYRHSAIHNVTLHEGQ